VVGGDTIDGGDEAEPVLGEVARPRVEEARRGALAIPLVAVAGGAVGVVELLARDFRLDAGWRASRRPGGEQLVAGERHARGGGEEHGDQCDPGRNAAPAWTGLAAHERSSCTSGGGDAPTGRGFAPPRRW